MKRVIIKIDEELCDGCGLCVSACVEGAIALVDGKARLQRDDYCDGLGNCLPACPTGAISLEEREAAEYDEEAVKQNMATRSQDHEEPDAEQSLLPCGCPGSHVHSIEREDTLSPHQASIHTSGSHGSKDDKDCCSPHLAGMQPLATYTAAVVSELRQWPIQIKLVPVSAPFFKDADLLIAADCVAYAYAGFHAKFMRGKITLVGCPKLDSVDYTEKLAEIIRLNSIRSVTVVSMEVPCCSGIVRSAIEALVIAGAEIPLKLATISTDGRIVA